MRGRLVLACCTVLLLDTARETLGPCCRDADPCCGQCTDAVLHRSRGSSHRGAASLGSPVQGCNSRKAHCQAIAQHLPQADPSGALQSQSAEGKAHK